MEKKYDLEERTLSFAINVSKFTLLLQKTIANVEYIKQLIRSSSSVGANYIEANEAFSKRDFIFRAKICRKEAKESTYWLKLLHINPDRETDRIALIRESIELTKIFGAIVSK
ncbi:MAG: four helix bundle protein [Candidatus Margulisiibacteriota bacterium]